MVETSLNADVDGRLSVKELVELIQGQESCIDQIILASRTHAIDGKGDTALHICAAQGRLQFCDRLIRAGSDPSLPNNHGLRPHDRARENGHEVAAAQLESLLPNKVPIESKIEAIEASKEGGAEGDDRLILLESAPVSIEIENSAEDDLDWEFEGEEDATDFHDGQLIEDYDDDTFLFEGRVESLSDEDGADFDFDQVSLKRISIQGSGIIKIAVPTARNAETATFRSFLEGQRGRGGKAHSRLTKHFAIERADVDDWVDELLQKGRCDAEMIDALVSNVRGSFSYEALFANVFFEMSALGAMHDGEEQAFLDECEYPQGSIDRSDVADLLQSILSGSNIKPGVEAFALSRRAEESLFNRISDCERKISSVLVSSELLLSVVVMLGEQMCRGQIKPETVSELEIHPMRQTEDGDALSASLPYLTAYLALLADGDETDKDRKAAEDAVASMKLSGIGVELICRGLEGNASVDDARETLAEQAALRRSLFEAASVSQLTQLRRVAARFPVEELEEDDLFQDGYFGLAKSVEKFEAGRGNRLATYSQYGIRQSIGRAVGDSKSVIRIPVHFASKIRQFDRFDEGQRGGISRDDYLGALIKALQIELEEVHKIESVLRFPIEFDESHCSDLENESDPLSGVLDEQRKEVIQDFLEDLPERWADIIVRRFGLDRDNEMTLEQIGQIYSVTRERIRQIEAKALKWLRHPIRTKLLRELL